MERVTCRARLEHLFDPTHVVDVSDAVVDLAAPALTVPASLLRRLGLDVPAVGRERVPVRLWIEDRDMATDAVVAADDSPVRIGRIPLGYMQLVVDEANHRVVKSPANGGEWILDMF